MVHTPHITPKLYVLEAWVVGAAAYDHGGSTYICNFPLFFMQVCVVLRHKRHKPLTAIFGPIEQPPTNIFEHNQVFRTNV